MHHLLLRLCIQLNFVNRPALLAVVAVLGLLSACSHYDVSINDNVLYTPKPLLTDYQVADTHLADCIGQTISDDKVTRAIDLKRLRCTHAGIETLAGIEAFYGLVQLDLGDNAIANVAPLEKLSQLEMLRLSNNQIVSAEPLLRLIKLIDLDLEENPIADCRDILQLKQAVQSNNGLLLAPQHCRAH